MPATRAFCTTCQRHVHVSDGDPLTCPVCSSALLEGTESDPSTYALKVVLPSEAFLG